MAQNIPIGWTTIRDANLATFVHTASGFEVTEGLRRNWLVFDPSGRKMRGSFPTVLKACRHAEQLMLQEAK
jgi:hypothetical protein